MAVTDYAKRRLPLTHQQANAQQSCTEQGHARWFRRYGRHGRQVISDRIEYGNFRSAVVGDVRTICVWGADGILNAKSSRIPVAVIGAVGLIIVVGYIRHTIVNREVRRVPLAVLR